MKLYTGAHPKERQSMNLQILLAQIFLKFEVFTSKINTT